MGTAIVGRLVRLGEEIYNFLSVSLTNKHQFTGEFERASQQKPSWVALTGFWLGERLSPGLVQTRGLA